jgi:2-polyprenyl-3-methyl-5-hydroxy-6-metoxy-1,4-benzoquinol methylase
MAVVRPWLRGKTLDYGCGTGSLAQWIAPDQYCGFDPDEESIHLARHQFPRHRFETDLPGKEYFDTVVALAVFEHLAEPLTFLRSAKDRLKSGGQLLLTTPHPAFTKFHEWGARRGLFSQEAAHDHKELFDRAKLFGVAAESHFRVRTYKRFLGMANQFIVLEPMNCG